MPQDLLYFALVVLGVGGSWLVSGGSGSASHVKNPYEQIFQTDSPNPYINLEGNELETEPKE
jgi:hypothetical protein